MAPDLTEISEARRIVLAETPSLPTEQVPLSEAIGRVLAEQIRAPEPVPAFDNSAMDGFAIRAQDVQGASADSPRALRLAGESRAGAPAGVTLGAGEAIAISTGAVVPDGADAVVRVEDTRDREGEIEVLAEAGLGKNIRRAGEDMEAGEPVLDGGSPIGPAELGVLASAARPEAPCAARPRVSVVLTGDELIGPGDPLSPGAVRNSNAFTVPALVQGAGGRVDRTERVGDDPQETRETLSQALRADVVVVCGGVSVGPHDHVRPALAELGVAQRFWGVALRPGKPTYFGTHPSGTLVFGLPGNPVSAFVCFLLFARPALLAMQGLDPAARRTTAVLAEDYPKAPGRAHAVRCTLEATGDRLVARTTGEQGSHILTSMIGAQGLAMIPSASAGARAGDLVEVELLPGSTL